MRMASVSTVPCLPSRTSLRNNSTSEGYGPTVSVGVTAHAAFVDVVAVVVVDEGLVGEPLHPSASAAPAAPTAPRASRRVINLESAIHNLHHQSDGPDV